MRSITRATLNVLQGDQQDPVLFCSIRPAGATAASALRLTTIGQTTTWNGQSWYPARFSRPLLRSVLGSVSREGGDAAASVAIDLTDVPEDVLMDVLNRMEFERALIQVWQTDRRLQSNPRDAMRVVRGRCAGTIITLGGLVLQVKDAPSQLAEVIIPKRTFQRQCNLAWGSRACGADVAASPNTINLTVVNASRYAIDVDRATVVAAAAGADPADFWAAGYIRMMDGQAAPLFRPVQRVFVDPDNPSADARIYLAEPLRVAPSAGDALKLIRGCRRTKEDCADRQGNFLQHGGFEEVPYGQMNKEPLKVR
jgi:hypothetical protein